MDRQRLERVIFSYLIDQASLFYVHLDADGVVLQASRYAERMVGRPLTGEPFASLVVSFRGDVDIETLIDADAPQRLNITSDGRPPESLYFLGFTMDDGMVLLGQVDADEVEQLRSGMLRLNNDLNNLSRELQKSNAELKRLNDLKNQFLGMAAHDLRNPIGVVMAYSEFLLDEAIDALTEEQAEFVRIIRDSSEFMLRLLNDLLDITRIESGRLSLEFIPTDFADFIRRNVALNRVLAEKKGTAIVLQVHERIPEIAIDQSKIEQVLNNLISNAVKYSPARTTVHIDVFLSGGQVTVAVKDEGPGIPPEDVKLLFKPFSVASTRATGGEKSTGLGLAIVRRIVAGHLGKIWVDTEVGRGSIFYFTLPLTRGQEASA